MLERAKIHGEDRTAFEELAAYLAVPPNTPDEHEFVYREVGDWWRRKMGASNKQKLKHKKD